MPKRLVKSFGPSLGSDKLRAYSSGAGAEAAMKPYIIGAICVWLLLGIAGAVMLGQERVDVPTIAGGAISFWNGLNKPVDS